MFRRAALSSFVLFAAVWGSAAAEREPPEETFSPELGILLRGEASRSFSLADSVYAPGENHRGVFLRLRPGLVAAPSESVELKAEGQWLSRTGDEGRGSHTSVYQLYVQKGDPEATGIRVGRQEIVYGSAFMLGADAFQDGLSFDAVRAAAVWGGYRAGGFAARYVSETAGDVSGELYGVFAGYGIGDAPPAYLYALLDTGSAGTAGTERTFSVGASLRAKVGWGLCVELEPVFQFGRTRAEGGRKRVRAFGGHVDATWGTEVAEMPLEFFGSYAYGSGDVDRDDGTFRGFRNPNHDTPLVGDIGIVGDMSGYSSEELPATGLSALTAAATVGLSERVRLVLDAHAFRAARTPSGLSEHIGTEVNLVVIYRLSEKLSLIGSANRFFVGPFLRDTRGDEDVDYFYLQLEGAL